MSKIMIRGALVVLEGCDRSGKSTQCKMLKETLTQKGYPTELMRFPERDTAIGKVIGDYLSKKCELEDHAVHLLFSANRWELLPKIKETLSRGINIIIDRYAYSGVAFTAAKEGFTLDWCKQSDSGLPQPDLVLYLTLSAEEAARRGQYGEERYEKTDFQRRVAENYRILSKADENWQNVDANCDIDTLHKKLTSLIEHTIQSNRNNEMKPLWTRNNEIY